MQGDALWPQGTRRGQPFWLIEAMASDGDWELARSLWNCDKVRQVSGDLSVGAPLLICVCAATTFREERSGSSGAHTQASIRHGVAIPSRVRGATPSTPHPSFSNCSK